jgi:hypothetical protein
VEHTAAAFGRLHLFPHAPQLLTSVAVLCSHPLESIPSQFPHPAMQGPRIHVSSKHLGIAFGNGRHFLLHAPQWVTSKSRLTQANAQAVRGEGHVTPHTPVQLA